MIYRTINMKWKKKASYTVEAAFVFPIAFYALLIFLYLFIMLHTEFLVYQGMLSLSEKLYSQGTGVAYVKGSGIFLNGIKEDMDKLNISREWLGEFLVKGISYSLGSKYLEKEFDSFCSENKLKFSMIKGGAGGVSFDKSKIFIDNGKISLVAEYTIVFPGGIIKNANKKICQKLSVNSFYGSGWELVKEFEYEKKEEKPDDKPNENRVYITTNGTVYHTNEKCTYIFITPDKIPYRVLGEKRSASGAIYHPCEECTKNKTPGTFVYITEYGTRFHVDKSCSKIERHVESVDEKYAKELGLRLCSKCSKGK